LLFWTGVRPLCLKAHFQNTTPFVSFHPLALTSLAALCDSMWVHNFAKTVMHHCQDNSYWKSPGTKSWTHIKLSHVKISPVLWGWQSSSFYSIRSPPYLQQKTGNTNQASRMQIRVTVLPFIKIAWYFFQNCPVFVHNDPIPDLIKAFYFSCHAIYNWCIFTNRTFVGYTETMVVSSHLMMMSLIWPQTSLSKQKVLITHLYWWLQLSEQKVHVTHLHWWWANKRCMLHICIDYCSSQNT